MAWTGPDELVTQVQRLWDQGRLLSCAVPFGELAAPSRTAIEEYRARRAAHGGVDR
jgi:hypothetical protein